MIKTFGLTHIALPVKDVKRSFFFYQKVFGVKEMYCYPDFIQVQTPGVKTYSFLKNKRKKQAIQKKDFISVSGYQNLPI